MPVWEVKIIDDVLKEYLDIKEKYPILYNSLHEAYGVIVEELKEVEEEIFKKAGERNLDNLYTEAIQLSASAFALAVFLERGKKKEE